MSIYSNFCFFIKNTFFKEEYKGEFISFIVDDNFINSVCENLNIEKKSLFDSVKSYMKECYYKDIIDINFMGVFIIQLYAASLRENNDSYTVASYRTHLCFLLDINIKDLNEWMKYCQDELWKHLYKWCDDNGFVIMKFNSKPGSWRYVSYILKLSKNTFTHEDMKYFGYNFDQYGLCPDEEISEKDFWRIVDKDKFKGYTKHSEFILNNILVDDSVCSQIYNYYLKWDGSFIEPRVNASKSTAAANEYHLYLSNYFQTIEIRDESLTKIVDFDITELSYRNISKYFKLKHKGVILLRENDDYDGMFEETRYLEDDETGIVIILTNCSHKHFLYEKIKMYSGIMVAKIERNETTEFLYSSKKPFKLIGGLRLSKNTYIYGGSPLLEISGINRFWLDGEAYETKEGSNTYTTDLDIGKHLLKFKGFSPVKLDVVPALFKLNDWKNTYKQWQLCNSMEDKSWNVGTTNDSNNEVLGLDFSHLKTNTNKGYSIVKSWINAHQCKLTKNEDNFIIKSIINSNEYGNK